MGTERFVLNYLSKNEVGHEGTTFHKIGIIFRLLILRGKLRGGLWQKGVFQGFVMSRVKIHTEPNGSDNRSIRSVWCIFTSPTVAAQSSRLAIRDQNDLGDRKGRQFRWRQPPVITIVTISCPHATQMLQTPV